MRNASWECRGYPTGPPKKGHRKGRWGSGFTTVWGYLANRPTKKKG